jgi:aspartyl-tRNA synthetase
MSLFVDATSPSRSLDAAERGEAPRLQLSEIRAEAYDVVLNGVEIGGGSMRIYEPELQEKMFEALGISPEARESQFGHLLRALRRGAPPHGGIAPGLDRIVMLICGEQSIREVMAFPKNNRGMDLMSESPAEVDPRQLRELGIKLAGEKLEGRAPLRPK